MKTVLFSVAVAVACLLLVDESAAAPQERQNPEESFKQRATRSPRSIDGPRPMGGPRPDGSRGPKGPDGDRNRNGDGRKMEMPPHVTYKYQYAVDENTVLPLCAFVLNNTDMAAVISGSRTTSFAPFTQAIISYDSSNSSTLALIVPFAPYYPCFVFKTTLTHRDIVQTLQAQNGSTVSNLPQVSLDGRNDPASPDQVAKLVESNPSILKICSGRSIVFTDGISGDMDGDDDNTMTEVLYVIGLEAEYAITRIVLEQPNTPEMARPGRSIDLYL